MPTVSFQQQKVETSPGKTLLDSLLDNNIDYPHGCLNGSCGLCIMKVEDDHCLSPIGEVEKDTLSSFSGENTRLGCRAKIKGDNCHIIISDQKD